MTISVLIIAHNEEKNIKNCIESVLNQTQKPNEVVLICHNCTDGTESIAEIFKDKIKVVKYLGREGVPYARIEGFNRVTGDIVACLDGDSVAHKNWLGNITKPLVANKSITIVAGYVILTNSFYSRLSSFWQFVILKKFIKVRVNLFAWGSSFACRRIDYEKVGGFEPIIDLKSKLNLNFWAEDFYLSLALMKIGEIHISLNAKSHTKIPNWKINPTTAPNKEWFEDNQKLLSYFKT